MDSNDGLIDACGTSGCWNTLGARRCCDFQQGNYIVLHPGELEAAQAAGQSTAHLRITDHDYHGGKKAVCKATCTATCDNGFKPLDCVSYPFFPAPPRRDEVDWLIKGKKCPLQPQHLRGHAALVRDIWNEAADRNPEIAAWLTKIELVGYSEPVQPVAAAPAHRKAA